jgi:hypothetical protein
VVDVSEDENCGQYPFHAGVYVQRIGGVHARLKASGAGNLHMYRYVAPHAIQSPELVADSNLKF